MKLNTLTQNWVQPATKNIFGVSPVAIRRYHIMEAEKHSSDALEIYARTHHGLNSKPGIPKHWKAGSSLKLTLSQHLSMNASYRWNSESNIDLGSTSLSVASEQMEFLPKVYCESLCLKSLYWTTQTQFLVARLWGSNMATSAKQNSSSVWTLILKASTPANFTAFWVFLDCI